MAGVDCRDVCVCVCLYVCACACDLCVRGWCACNRSKCVYESICLSVYLSFYLPVYHCLPTNELRVIMPIYLSTVVKRCCILCFLFAVMRICHSPVDFLMPRCAGLAMDLAKGAWLTRLGVTCYVLLVSALLCPAMDI